jgi:geranyl-CoA carboxylase beta subunit
MNVFQTRIDRHAEGYGANQVEMLALVQRMRQYEARAEALSEKRRETFAQRGQLTPRERVVRLLDPGLPFLELYNLANFLVEDSNRETSVPGASMVCGIGFVSGVRCLVVADDSGINAGAVTPMSVPKILGAMDIALAHKLPFIHLVESAGANLLQYAVETWAHGGGLYYRRALMGAAGLPTISVLHGLSTAGGAYQPGLSDYVVGVKGNGMAALGGSALVRAATGEISDDRELGSSEMHATVSGLVEYLADDDAHGLRIAREIMASLDWNRHCPSVPRDEVRPPLYDTGEIAGIASVDYRKPYDVREVIARLTDGSEFLAFKPRYGVSTVCVQGRVFGHACGIVGNNGPIDPAGATKAAQFMQLCDQAQMPLVFLNNTTGFMVGREYERGGMIKHGSKMIQAVSNVRVPRISFYIGASFGAGNYAMCGAGFKPDFLFAWPNAYTGVMGGEQAAGTMEHVARVAAKRRGFEPDEAALAKQRAAVVAHFDRQSDAFYTSGRCLDHGVIDPRDTRRVLGFVLDTVWEGRHRTVQPNAFGVGRM